MNCMFSAPSSQLGPVLSPNGIYGRCRRPQRNSSNLTQTTGSSRRSTWRTVVVVTAVWLSLGFAASDSAGQQWPRWRGPHGDGTWAEGKLDRSWNTAWQPEWRQKIGPGFSGVTMAAGRVYTMDRQVTEPRLGEGLADEKSADEKSADEKSADGANKTAREKPQNLGQERVLCFDALSGKPLWQHRVAVDYRDLDYGKGPRASVTIDGDRAFALGAMGNLWCLDAGNGRLLWQTHLVRDLGGEVPMWGYAASPVVHGDLLIVHPGGEGHCYVALDKTNGTVRWQGGDDPAGYATPVLARFGKRQVLIGWTPEHILGLDADSGQSLWKYPYKVTYGVSIATPIVHNDIVFVAGYWEGARALRISEDGGRAELLWEDQRELRGLMAQPLQRDGLAFLLDRSQGVVCFDLKTGEKRWTDQHRLTPRGRNPQLTLVWLGKSDRFLGFNSQGELIGGRLTPAGVLEQGRSTLSGDSWAHPAYGLQRVIVRDDEQIVAFRTVLND